MVSEINPNAVHSQNSMNHLTLSSFRICLGEPPVAIDFNVQPFLTYQNCAKSHPLFIASNNPFPKQSPIGFYKI